MDDIILSVNGNMVDYNGYVKFDFFPGEIPVDDLGLWFIEGNILEFKICAKLIRYKIITKDRYKQLRYFSTLEHMEQAHCNHIIKLTCSINRITY